MASNEIFFFATANDLKTGLNNMEASRPIKYIWNKSVEVLPHTIYNSNTEISSLGINLSGDHQTESFLILDKEEEPVVDAVRQTTGGVRYFVHHNKNPNSIVFWPGGDYNGIAIIAGHVNTISQESLSKDLFKIFSKNLTKGFKKVGRYWIGPEALEQSKSKRLVTMTINQPEIYDVKV